MCCCTRTWKTSQAASACEARTRHPCFCWFSVSEHRNLSIAENGQSFVSFCSPQNNNTWSTILRKRSVSFQEPSNTPLELEDFLPIRCFFSEPQDGGSPFVPKNGNAPKKPRKKTSRGSGAMRKPEGSHAASKGSDPRNGVTHHMG